MITTSFTLMLDIFLVTDAVPIVGGVRFHVVVDGCLIGEEDLVDVNNVLLDVDDHLLVGVDSVLIVYDPPLTFEQINITFYLISYCISLSYHQIRHRYPFDSDCSLMKLSSYFWYSFLR
ncbi:MAG: hypothetical protein GY928_08625 [Colwellia sp.]|nr:hypothetical protein [Colwellia sp.]